MNQGELELAAYAAELDSADAAARAIVANHSTEALERRPSSGGWSAAECLDHVGRTASAYMPAIRAALEQGRSRGLAGAGPFRYGLLARMFLRFIEPPPLLKTRTPAVLAPVAQPSADEALASFLAGHTELQALLQAANGLDLAAIRLASPAWPKLVLPVGAVFAILAAHARRHLRQAREALSESET